VLIDLMLSASSFVMGWNNDYPCFKVFFLNFPVVAVNSYFSHFCFHRYLAVRQVSHGNRQFKMNELIQNN
jgi:hypothetical protein